MKMNTLRFIGASTVNFPILGADPSGPFVLKGADGLGPTKRTVRMLKTVVEKAVYQGVSADLRQITAVVGLQPDWDIGQTAEELREVLYGLLAPRYGNLVRCEIVDINGTVVGFAQGQLSSLEPALFSKDPAVQIVLDCDYAYFLAPDVITQEPAQRNINGKRAFDVTSPGTAETAFKMGVILRANVGSTLTLSESDPNGGRIEITGINWVAGDRFIVDTRPGTLNVWRGAAGGTPVTVVNNLNVEVSDWLRLYKGVNTLLLNTTAFDWDPAYKFSYQPAFLGV